MATAWILVLGAAAAVGAAAWARVDRRGALSTVATLAFVTVRCGGANVPLVAKGGPWPTDSTGAERPSSKTPAVRRGGSVSTQRPLQPDEQGYVHDGEGVVLHVSRLAPPA